MFTYKNATPATFLEIINVYRSIMMWRGHNVAMAKSAKHTAVMMGEYDDPDMDDEGSGYNPLSSAGFFGICCAIETLVQSWHGELEHNKKQISHAVPVAQQLLFSLLINDDAANAQIVNQMRTGYIGNPEQCDIDRVPEFKKYLGQYKKFMDSFDELAQAGKWEEPLTRHVYDYPHKSYDAHLVIEFDSKFSADE